MNPYLECYVGFTFKECVDKCTQSLRCTGVEYRRVPDRFGYNCVLIDTFEIIPAYGSPEKATCWRKNYDLISGTHHERPVCNNRFQTPALEEQAEKWQTLMSCTCSKQDMDIDRTIVGRTWDTTRVCATPDVTPLPSDSVQEKQDKEALKNFLEERLKLAMVNRMWHLCRNWCVFDVDFPRTTSFYWDPFFTDDDGNIEECWRTQVHELREEGEEHPTISNAHDNFCFREHINKNSIEFQFILKRASTFCNHPELPSYEPTSAPINVDGKSLPAPVVRSGDSADGKITWRVSDNINKSCTNVCGVHLQHCEISVAVKEYLPFSNLLLDLDRSMVEMAFKRIGIECSSIVIGVPAVQGPAFEHETMACMLRHPEQPTEYLCSFPAGEEEEIVWKTNAYRRICPCVDKVKDASDLGIHEIIETEQSNGGGR